MMTEYLVLWLSVSVFIAIGMLTNIVFFRRARTHKKTSRPETSPA